jgi:(p)ppGpp synthase/HD superfamily hydrolase
MLSANPEETVKFAEWFMTGAHEGVAQTVKWTGAPYYIHPKQVHTLLLKFKSVLGIEVDWQMECAAFLHDVVEDTKVTNVSIQHLFGDDVAALVSDLTDVALPTDGNRAARVAINRAHTATASVRAKIVKTADLCCNTYSIVEQNPDFARVYLPEKRLLLEEAMQDIPPRLLVYAWDVVRAAEHRMVQCSLEQLEKYKK